MEDDLAGQVCAEAVDEVTDGVLVEQLRRLRRRGQCDLGARLGQRLVGRAHVVGPVGPPAPPQRHGLAAGGQPGPHLHLVGHEEAGEEADAELADEALACDPEVVPLRQASDRGEDVGDPGLVQAHAGVEDVQPAVGGDVGRGHVDAARTPGLGLGPRRDRVDGVLQQLAQVDAGAGVEVLGQQVDHALEVDPEVLTRLRSHSCPSPMATPAARTTVAAGRDARAIRSRGSRCRKMFCWARRARAPDIGVTHTSTSTNG